MTRNDQNNSEADTKYKNDKKSPKIVKAILSDPNIFHYDEKCFKISKK